MNVFGLAYLVHVSTDSVKFWPSGFLQSHDSLHCWVLPEEQQKHTYNPEVCWSPIRFHVTCGPLPSSPLPHRTGWEAARASVTCRKGTRGGGRALRWSLLPLLIPCLDFVIGNLHGYLKSSRTWLSQILDSGQICFHLLYYQTFILSGSVHFIVYCQMPC